MRTLIFAGSRSGGTSRLRMAASRIPRPVAGPWTLEAVVQAPPSEAPPTEGSEPRSVRPPGSRPANRRWTRTGWQPQRTPS